MSANNQQSGFTLIELMIAMVVIAIVTAVAVPSYGAYVQRASRADAKATLGQVQQFMQRFYAMNNAYDQMLDGTAVALPAALQQSPMGTGPKRYTITVAATPVGYTLTATPNNAQSTDECGVLTITNTNVRTAAGAGTAEEVAKCWR